MTLRIEQVAADLAAEWKLRLGEPLTGGTFAYAVDAIDGDGRACVLKVNPPDVETAGTYESERDLLQAAAGRGYVALYRHDDERRAFLLERLGDKMIDDGRSIDEWIASVAAVCVTTWGIGLPRPASLMTAAEKCVWFVDYLDRAWREQSEPCPRSVIDEAIRFAEQRGSAYDPSASVVLHGDAHPWNMLAAPGGGWKFIDPDPFFGEPAADLGVVMREWNAEMLATGDPRRAVQRRAVRLADATGTDADAVWQWGFIERVASGLVCNAEGTVDWARDAFATAEACVGAGPS